jgi:hypothetical protein
MAGVRAVKNKFIRLRNALPDLRDDAIEGTKDHFIALNQQQMLQGLDANGNTLGQYKNPAYARMKNKMNPLPGYGIKDFRLTGAYYRGFFLFVDDGKIRMGSMDPKAVFLMNKGKDYRFGLMPENKRTYVHQDFTPEFKRLIIEQLKR